MVVVHGPFLFLVVLFMRAYCTNGYYWRVHKVPDIKVINLDYDPTNPLSIIGEERKTIYLSCRIESSEQFKWKWQHDGKEINTPPPYIIPWKYGSVLMVRPLLKGRTDGIYDCIAENRYLKMTGTVDVSVKKGDLLPEGFPRIVKQPADVRTRRMSVDFNCKVSGKAPLHITWYQNRNPIIFDSVYEVSHVDYGNGVVASNLRIKNTTTATNSFYQCVVTNGIGQAVSDDAQILFGKSRRKRDTESKLRWKCPRNPTNKTHSAGPIDKSSINIQCLKSSNESYMDIRWDQPEKFEKVEHYAVTISSPSIYSFLLPCFTTNVNHFKFDRSKGFKPSVQDDYTRYGISVDTFPSSGENSLVIEVGGCPRIGELSEWGSWGDCNCVKCEKDKERCIGTMHRTIKCINVYDGTEEYHTDCKRVKVDESQHLCSTDCNQVSAEPKKRKLRSSRTEVKYEFILIGVLGATVLIGWILFVVRNRRQSDLQHSLIASSAGKVNVYISYLTEAHKEERLLGLIHYISGFGINCIVDLLSQVEINNSGGLPNWLPNKISNADKILVVLSKTYIKALNSIEDGLELVPDKVCKVHTEFNLIKTIMYHSCQRTPQLVIVLDGVKKDEIPDVFRGRHHCSYPKKFEMDDDSCRNLIGLLFDEEPLQIVSKSDLT